MSDIPSTPPPDGEPPGHVAPPQPPPLPTVLNPPPTSGADPPPGYLLPPPDFHHVPATVARLGTVMLVGGIVDLLYGVAWFIMALLIGISSSGVGFICCLSPAIVMGVGVAEIMQSARLKENPQRRPALQVMLAQMASILWCNPITAALGVYALVLSRSEEAAKWYARW